MTSNGLKEVLTSSLGGIHEQVLLHMRAFNVQFMHSVLLTYVLSHLDFTFSNHSFLFIVPQIKCFATSQQSFSTS